MLPPFPYRNDNDRRGLGREDMECAAAGSTHQFAASYSQNINNNNASNAMNYLNLHQHNHNNAIIMNGGTDTITNNNNDVVYSTSESGSVDTHTNSVSTSLLVGTFYNPASETDSYSMEENINQYHCNSNSNQPQQPINPVVTSDHSWKEVFANHDAFEGRHSSTNIPSNNPRRMVYPSPDELLKSGCNIEDGHNHYHHQGMSNDPLGDDHQRRRTKLLWGFVFLVCLLLGVAVSMGIVIGVKHAEKQQPKRSRTENSDAFTFGAEQEGEEEEGSEALNNTSSPSSTAASNNNDEELEEDMPTTSSTSDSEAPSASPTAIDSIITTSIPTVQPGPPSTTQSINAFVSQLPPYTQDPLEVPGSPQSRALHWLTADPFLRTYSVTRLLQRYALATLFFATNGGNDELVDNAQWLDMTGWLSYNQHECSWFSTYTGGNPCQSSIAGSSISSGTTSTSYSQQESSIYLYTHLSLRRNNLQGTLPPEIALLAPHLKVLDLELNSIQGSLPSQIGLMTGLERLVVRSNDCTGWLPTEMGRLTQMVDLQVENNDLIGSIPTELGMMKELRNITLDDNLLTSRIPTELGSLSFLENIMLHGNQLSGVIPSELGVLERLQSLSLRDNVLTSSIPSEIGLLTNLERLWAYQNAIQGSIPSELGLATKLSKLSLSRNRLTGTVPATLGQLTLLENLWLYENDLSGSVPDNVCSLLQQSNLEVTVDCDELECDCGCTCAGQDHDDFL